MGEIEIQVEFSGNRFVLRELLAVVGGQGVRVIGEGAQLLKDGLRDVIGRAPFDLLQQGQSRFAFVERDDGLLSAQPENGVHFPIPDPLALVHDVGSLVDADAIRELSAPFIAPVSFATLFWHRRCMCKSPPARLSFRTYW